MRTNRILILGNSITRHAPTPAIGWTADCGMAASAVEKDYAHIFLQALAARVGRQPEARIVNIAGFERDFESFDIATSLAEEIAFKADVVIVAIGDNVPAFVNANTKSRFKARLLTLLAAVKSRPDAKLFVQSCFWPDRVKNDLLGQACASMGGCFVDISTLGGDESNYARAERDFNADDVAAHPGDKGMRAIADALLTSYLATSQVNSHAAPRKEVPSADYALTVNGQSVFVHQARVSAYPLNQVWPGYQRPLEQTELAGFASWDMDVPVEVRVVCSHLIQQVKVCPASRGIQPRVEGNTVSFTVRQPGQYTVEVNGAHHALHLFADPLETGAPDPKDPSVRYFAPGVHYPGLITLTSGQSLYLAGGAVVYGAVVAEYANDIAIFGRGILDGSKFDRMQLTGLISLYACRGVRIDGITLRDPSGFTIVPAACQQVHIRNVKLIGNWRYNTDGIDFINCQHCSVEDSFIRSFDDSICLKGYDYWGPFIYALQLFDGKFDGNFTIDGKTPRTFSHLQRVHGRFLCLGAPLHDIQVRRCVIWNDWGRALEIGLETVATHISDVLFEDCDLIHVSDVALDVQNGDHAHCHHLTFRNIRVELHDCPRPQLQCATDQRYSVPPGDRYLPHLLMLHIIKGYCNYSSERGHISDIRFEDIQVTAPGVPPSKLIGFDDDHLVRRVTIERLRINGQLVTTLQAGGITANEFVQEVTIRARQNGHERKSVSMRERNLSSIRPGEESVSSTGEKYTDTCA